VVVGTDLCDMVSMDGSREWCRRETLTRSTHLSGLADHPSASDRHIEARTPAANIRHTDTSTQLP